MAISVNPSLYILLVMVAVMLFLMARNTRHDNRKVYKILAMLFLYNHILLSAFIRPGGFQHSSVTLRGDGRGVQG